MQYQRETVRDTYEEAKPLLVEHYLEIAHYQDIPLEPDYASYASLEDAGITRVYTARNEGELIGYAVFFVRKNIHYSSSLQAIQDIIYIHPKYRGQGGRFIVWCDAQLKAEGVQVVYHHVKASHNWGPLLERIGYQLIDHIYGRRLDQ